MRTLSIVCLLACTANLSAQIPLPKFQNTYSGAATRGFYFQAPTALVLTHAQVPDETNYGKQIIAIYKLTSAPPAYSQTLDAKPAAYIDEIPSSTCWQLPTPVIYNKGDWVAVIGACGTTSGTVYNSYGTASFASEVLGMPITLQRCGSQINIATTKGVLTGTTSGMWSENAYQISRVRLTFAGSPSSCAHCTPSNGTASLTLCDDKPAISGKTAGITIASNGASNTAVALAIGLGRANINVPGLGTLCASPIPLVVYGLPAAASGGTNYTFSIPNGSAGKISIQAALLGGPSLALTNGLEIGVGN
ncbi:MAG: hypothetical protein KDC87_17600 [Planctomycetes bacterium]|nr:hypothetical protein [Planctomycetota bacterium]MCB9868940.1 hypothetical protein [Planctomycetota bacterium]